MNVLKRMLPALLIAALCLCCLSAAAESDADYEGVLFSGKDPWENDLAVEILSARGDSLSWTYTEDFFGETLYQAFENVPMADGVCAFHIAGAVLENEYTTCEYTGTLALRDGAVVLTYDSGEMTESSPNGGSTSYHVEALSEEERTVVLTPADEEEAIPEWAERYSDVWVEDGVAVEIWYQDGMPRVSAVLGDGSDESEVIDYASCRYDESADTLICEDGQRRFEAFNEAADALDAEVKAEGLTASFSFIDGADALRWDDSEGRFGDLALKRLSDAEEEDWEASQAFAGDWVCERASIAISEREDGAFSVLITWGSSAWETAEWRYECAFDGADGMLHSFGEGVKEVVTYNDAGDEASTEEHYRDGEATFSLDGDGNLLWNDHKEDAGAGMTFEPVA